jgi:hypothetical protein
VELPEIPYHTRKIERIGEPLAEIRRGDGNPAILRGPKSETAPQGVSEAGEGAQFRFNRRVPIRQRSGQTRRSGEQLARLHVCRSSRPASRKQKIQPRPVFCAYDNGVS